MIKIGEAAKILNLCIKTLQRWDKLKILVAYRTPTNRRYYTTEQLENFVNAGKTRNTK